MRIPSSINDNTLKAYEIPYDLIQGDENTTLQSYNFKNWDENIPKSLQTICIVIIAKHWSGMLLSRLNQFLYLTALF